MRLLVDMNLSPRWVALLNGSGIEAAHWSTIGAHDAADSEIMAYAAEHDYVVLTHDLDFSAILAATQGAKPSVVQVRAELPNSDAVGAQVVSAVKQMSSELQAGALLTIDSDRKRLRLLPLPQPTALP